MLGDVLFLYWFRSLAHEVGFHFVLEQVSRFYVYNDVWDITPDLAPTYEKLFVRIPTVVLVAGDYFCIIQ